MFFIRNDQTLLKRAERRLKSPRASVFSEFAFLSPILVMFISAMIELASFWDARVMATHAVWAIGRMASVRAEEGQTSSDAHTLHGLKFGEKYTSVSSNSVTVADFAGPFKTALGSLTPDLPTMGDVTALYMMSTCGIGAFGSKSTQTASAKDLKNLFTQQGSMIATELTAYLRSLVDEKLSTIPTVPDTGVGFIDEVKKKIMNKAMELVQKAVDAVFSKVVSPLLSLIGGVIDKLFSLIFGIDDAAKADRIWQRMAQRMNLAASRISTAGSGYKLEYMVPEDGDLGMWSPYGNLDSARSAPRGKVFYYPRSATADLERDAGWIKYSLGWPVNAQRHSVVTVSLDWPFSGSWLFPIIGGYKSSGEPVTVHAKSIAYLQPNIDDANLKSEGAVSYPQGVASNPKSIDDLDIGNYMKMVFFALRYRMRCECITHGPNTGTHGAYTSYDPIPLWDNLIGQTPVDDKGNATQSDQWTKLVGSSQEQMCYKCTVRMLAQQMDGGRSVVETGPFPPVGWDRKGKYADDYNTLKKHHGYYYRAQYGYDFTQHVYNFGFRNYLCWPTYNRCYSRYAGPNTCYDHLFCGEYVKDRMDEKFADEYYKQFETKDACYGYWNDSSTLFFDQQWRAEPTLNEPRIHNPEYDLELTAEAESRCSGLMPGRTAWNNREISEEKERIRRRDGTSFSAAKCQLVRTAKKLNEIPEFCWFTHPEAGDTTSRGYDASNSKWPSEAHEHQWVDSWNAYFAKNLRLNLHTMLFLCITGKDEVRKEMETCRVMRSGKIDGRYHQSVLLAQALDFNVAMWMNLDKLWQQMDGADGGTEKAEDLVDEECIKMYNDNGGTVVTDPRAWWEEQKKRLNEYQEELDKSICNLHEKCCKYGPAVDAFVHYFRTTGIKDLRESLDQYLICWHNPSSSKGNLFPDANSTDLAYNIKANFDATIGLRDTYSSGNVYVRCRDNFLKEWNALKKAYNDYLDAIVDVSQKECALADMLGYAASNHGRRPLTADDIYGEETVWEDPENPPPPSGGDPDASGNDTYPFGDAWKLGPKGWE